MTVYSRGFHHTQTVASIVGTVVQNVPGNLLPGDTLILTLVNTNATVVATALLGVEVLDESKELE
jgi:hypothetical protein